MNKFLLWVCFIFISGIHCFGQEPFQSVLQNTRDNHYYWPGNNGSLVLPLADGGYIVKDIISPSNPINYYGTNFYATVRITRFNSCHNKVWSKSIDSTITNSFLFVLHYRNPGADPKNYPAPYPKSYTNLFDGSGAGSSLFSPGESGLINTIIATTDDCFVNCDLMGERNFDTPPVVTKFDKNGKVLWSKKLNKTVPSGKVPVYYSQSCIATNNGGCMIVFIGFNSSIYDTFPVPYISITKLDKNGKIIKSGRFFSPVYNSISSGGIGNLLKMPDGGFTIHIGGYYANTNVYGSVIGLARIDSTGKVIWAKYIYSTGNYEEGGNSVADSKGNIYVSMGYDNSYSNSKITIQKFDINGKPLWVKYLNDSISPYHYSSINGIGISKDDLLGAIVEYYSYGAYPGYHSFFVKFDANDSFTFAKQIKNYNADYNYDFIPLRTTSDSGFLSLDNNDYTYINNVVTYRILLTKLDKNGKGTCLGKDTTNVFNPGNISSLNISPVPTYPDSGFNIFDTNIVVKTSNFKESMLCAPGLFPIADLGGDTVVCTAKNYTLYVGDENIGAKYLWSTGDTTAKITIGKSGTYWVNMSNGNCTSTDTSKVVFFSLIKTSLPKTQSICPYDSVLLSVKDSIASYYWISPKKDTLQGRNITAKDSGYYYLMLNGTQSCASLDTVHVMYYPLPAATAGPDTVLCRDEAYTMQGAGGITYQWIPATYLSSSTDPNAIATLPNTQHYILVVSNKQGCHDTSQVLLKVHPPLTIKAIVNNAEVCYGQTIVLSAIAHGGDSLHYKFKWINDGANGDYVAEKAYQSGWHKVIVSDNCTPVNVADSVYITVIPPTKAVFIYSPATKIKTNHDVSFINQSTNAASYLWTFGTNDSSKQVSPVYIYTDTGDYKITLVAYGFNNCPNDTAYGFIKLITDQVTIYIPNAFSPNGDGVNDYFDISGIGIKSYSYNIYNRWGEHIYSSPLERPGEAGWDATFHGVGAPEGVYLYQLDVTDIFDQHHYLSGNVTLMR